jgi:hypothetical protein
MDLPRSVFNAFSTSPFGNVGIGTASPTAMLHVMPSNPLQIPVIVKATSSQTADLFNVEANVGSNGNIFTIESNRYVGIGKPDPTNRFMVQHTSANMGDVVADFIELRTTTGDLATYVVGVSRQGVATPALYFGNDGNNNGIIAANNSNLRFGKDLGSNFSGITWISGSEVPVCGNGDCERGASDIRKRSLS